MEKTEKPKPPDNEIVKLVVKNGFVRDVIMPPASRVEIYDYDLRDYDSYLYEEDEKGKKCVIRIWTRYVYDPKTHAQQSQIDRTLKVRVENGRVAKVTGTKGTFAQIVDGNK